MRPNSVASGTAFVTAFLSLLVFITVLIGVGLAVFHLTKRNMFSLLEDQIVEELVLFEQIIANSGLDGLTEAIEKLEPAPDHGGGIVGLFDSDGTPLAGGREIAPDFIGWKNVDIAIKNSTETQQYRSSITRFSKASVVVGRSTEMIDASLDSLKRILQVAGLIVGILTIAIGYIASRSVRTRLQTLCDVLLTVSEGNLDARIPLDNSHSQLNYASAEINRHLNQLAILMQSTRNTINAIAHDLRSPLSRVSLQLQSLQLDDELNESQNSQLQSATTELKEVDHVFNTILGIARISTTKDADSFESFKIIPFVEDLIALLQPIAEENMQSLDIDIQCRTDDTLTGDIRMLRQMMVNLIENSVRHAGVNASIVVHAQRQPDGSLVLAVSDNGPGMPEELYEQALEPFFREDRSRSTPGTGLGLALVNAVAQHHRAEVYLGNNHPGLMVRIKFAA